MISKSYLDKFRNLYFQKFNIQLSEEEATKQATDLLNLMRILVKPDSK